MTTPAFTLKQSKFPPRTRALPTLPVMDRLARQAAQMPAQTRAGLRAKASLVLLLAEECDAAAGVLGVSLAADVAFCG